MADQTIDDGLIDLARTQMFAAKVSRALTEGEKPILQCLEEAAEGQPEAFRNAVLSVRSDLREGSTIAEAMAKFPEQFDAELIKAVEIGEQYASLDVTLDEYSRQE